MNPPFFRGRKVWCLFVSYFGNMRWHSLLLWKLIGHEILCFFLCFFVLCLSKIYILLFLKLFFGEFFCCFNLLSYRYCHSWRLLCYLKFLASFLQAICLSEYRRITWPTLFLEWLCPYLSNEECFWMIKPFQNCHIKSLQASYSK